MGEPITPARFEEFLAFVNGLSEARPSVRRILFDVGADLGACRAELAAQRGRAARAFGERDAARGEALAAGAETVRLAREWKLDRARVALLEGLLRPLIAAAVVDSGGGWPECNACVALRRDDMDPLHEDGCPVPQAIAALADGDGGA